MINFKNPRSNWRDDINITSDMKFNSTFQTAAIAQGVTALKWLSTSEQVNLAMFAQQTTAIDNADDHALHALNQKQEAMINELHAANKELTARLTKESK